jgi:hypothetical protein
MAYRPMKPQTPSYGPAVREPQKTIEARPSRTGSLVPALPLTVVPGSTSTAVKVIPGTINGLIPTLGGVALNAATPPEFTIPAGGTRYILAKVEGTFADGAGDSYVVTIVSETSPSIPASITPEGFVSSRRLATVVRSGSAITITPAHAGGHLNVESFGSANMWWVG